MEHSSCRKFLDFGMYKASVHVQVRFLNMIGTWHTYSTCTCTGYV